MAMNLGRQPALIRGSLTKDRPLQGRPLPRRRVLRAPGALERAWRKMPIALARVRLSRDVCSISIVFLSVGLPGPPIVGCQAPCARPRRAAPRGRSPAKHHGPLLPGRGPPWRGASWTCYDHLDARSRSAAQIAEAARPVYPQVSVRSVAVPGWVLPSSRRLLG